MKKSDILKAKIAELTDEAEALLNIAEKESRELTADEQLRWTAIMAKDSGEVAKLQTDLQAAIAHEEELARLQALRLANSAPTEFVYDRTGAKPAAAPLPSNVRVINPTLKAFTGNGNKEQAMRDAYDSALWFKSLLLSHTPRHAEGQAARDKLMSRRGSEWFATQNETTPTDGGYLVPPAFENAVVVYRGQVGVSRRLARVISMTSDNWTGVKQTSGTTVYYPGEEGAITASDVNLSRYTLQAKKRAILAYVSSELNEDAAVSVMDLLAQDMGHQFALQEDKEFVIGDGTSTYGGVTGVKTAVVAATASVYTPTADEDDWSELTLATHLAGMSLLADKYRGLPLAWLCSAPYKWQVMDRLSLAQGGAVASDVTGGIMGGSFLGYPVVVCDRMPTATAVSTVGAIFGAFQNAVIIGSRSGISVAVSPHYAFNTDQIAVRATTRYDIHCHEEGSTTAAGAIVGVSTHS